MKVAVLGAGVVGVATAYALAQRGHDVDLYDARPEAASDSSNSTAGLIAPGHSYAWASPTAPLMLVKSLLGGATAIQVRPSSLNLQLIEWGLRFMRECTPGRSRANTLAKLRLARYSQDLMRALADHERLDFFHNDRGILYLYRDQQSLDRAASHSQLLREHGRPQEVLTYEQAAALEPALRRSEVRFHGALYDRADGSGDPFRFSQGLLQVCEKLGVQWHPRTAVSQLAVAGNRIVEARTNEGVVKADAFVLAAGASSAHLARTAGVRLPIYPAKGYTVTVECREGEGPTLGGIDETSLVAWSRFGSHVRMSGTAEFVGHDRSHLPVDFSAIATTGDQLFPGALDWSTARYRTGLRPMTPDGPPLIGVTQHDNLYVNSGHGHVGWTMAVGSAALLADIVDGTPADIDPRPYLPRRR